MTSINNISNNNFNNKCKITNKNNYILITKDLKLLKIEYIKKITLGDINYKAQIYRKSIKMFSIDNKQQRALIKRVSADGLMKQKLINDKIKLSTLII